MLWLLTNFVMHHQSQFVGDSITFIPVLATHEKYSSIIIIFMIIIIIIIIILLSQTHREIDGCMDRETDGRIETRMDS